MSLKMSMGEVIYGCLILFLGIILVAYILRPKRGFVMEKKPKFEIFKDKDLKFRFRLKAPNGEIICQSEAYESKQACVDTINVLSDYAKKAGLVDLT